VPPEVLATLQDATRKALAAKDLRDKLEQQGVEIAPPTMPDQFSKLLQDDLAKWARIVKASGAAID
jgi:tripartite-type tricarboxylate transporter receptor subunit TctC